MMPEWRLASMLTELCLNHREWVVASWWKTSKEGTNLMLEYGITTALMAVVHHDCQAYCLRTGDKWIKIDYTKRAEEWLKPSKGSETGLVESPANWHLDDLPPTVFIKVSQLTRKVCKRQVCPYLYSPCCVFRYAWDCNVTKGHRCRGHALLPRE
jgi:hypothetical protein